MDTILNMHTKIQIIVGLHKENKLDGTQIWIKAYQDRMTMNGAVINSFETDIYYIAYSTTYTIVVNLKTSDGSINQTMKSTDLSCPNVYAKVKLSPDETYLYFQVQRISNSLGQVCKFKVNVNNYFECAELTGLLMPTTICLIENDVFFTAVETSPATNFFMIRINMSSGSFIWKSQIPCTSSPGSVGFSASLLSDDKSIVYTSTPVNANDLLFLQLKTADGTQTNSKYLFSIGCSEANALHKYKTKVYIIIYCNPSSYIVVHDTSDLSFAYYILSASGFKFHSFKTDSTENRMLACGHGTSGARSFSIITYEETLGVHFNITTSGNVFNAILPAQYSITSLGTATMVMSNYLITNTIPTSYAVSEVLDSDQFLSDVSYWLRDYYAYNLTHNTYIEKDINLICSASGGTSITHTMIANGANQIPSWVTIDAVNSKLLITTPLLTTETNFTFGISSYVSSDSKSYVRYNKQ